MHRNQIMVSAPTAPTATVMPAAPSSFPAARELNGALREGLEAYMYPRFTL